MIIATLRFQLLIHDAQSLKDKRRVVSAVKDRLHREHLAAVAEIAAQENPALAVLALAVVGSDGRHLGETLDRITTKLRGMWGGSVEAELGELARQILRVSPDDDEPLSAAPDDPESSPKQRAAIADELLRYAAGIDPDAAADADAALDDATTADIADIGDTGDPGPRPALADLFAPRNGTPHRGRHRSGHLPARGPVNPAADASHDATPPDVRSLRQ